MNTSDPVPQFKRIIDIIDEEKKKKLASFLITYFQEEFLFGTRIEELALGTVQFPDDDLGDYIIEGNEFIEIVFTKSEWMKHGKKHRTKFFRKIHPLFLAIFFENVELVKKILEKDIKDIKTETLSEKHQYIYVDTPLTFALKKLFLYLEKNKESKYLIQIIDKLIKYRNGDDTFKQQKDSMKIRPNGSWGYVSRGFSRWAPDTIEFTNREKTNNMEKTPLKLLTDFEKKNKKLIKKKNTKTNEVVTYLKKLLGADSSAEGGFKKKTKLIKRKISRRNKQKTINKKRKKTRRKKPKCFSKKY